MGSLPGLNRSVAVDSRDIHRRAGLLCSVLRNLPVGLMCLLIEGCITMSPPMTGCGATDDAVLAQFSPTKASGWPMALRRLADVPWESEWVDDEEFLAPPGMGRAGEQEGSDEDGLDPDDALWEPAQGFPDGHRAVRIWADEEGVLTRVRVSLNWREKLKKSSLENAFWTAFTAMNAVYHTAQHTLPLPEPLPVTPYPAVGWDALRMARHEREEIDARMVKLADAPPTRWIGQTTRGSDYEDGVIVILGIFGQPVSARFDPEWLKTSVRSSELSRGVLGAYRKARAKYRPPQVEFGERELLAREYTRINLSLLASLGNLL